MDKKTKRRREKPSEEAIPARKGKKGSLILIACGAVIGIVNGLFGGGGGLIAVPALTNALGLKTKSAHATAILVILPVSIVSAVIYIAYGKYFEPVSGLVCMAGITAGGAAGALLLSKLSNRLIRIVFVALMIGVGCKMLFGK